MIKSFLKINFLIIFLFFLVQKNCLSEDLSKNHIKKISVSKFSSYLNVNFELSKKPTYRLFTLSKPYRLVVDFEKSNSDRPKVVVYEKKKNSKFKLRVMYLQLVMMAGR